MGISLSWLNVCEKGDLSTLFRRKNTVGTAPEMTGDVE